MLTLPFATPGAPRVVHEEEVRTLLPQLDVRNALRALFHALGNDQAVQPPQSLTPFPQGAGDFITYLGVLSDAGVFGAKLSPYIVTPGRPVITAWTLLMSMATGVPLLLCDAALLTVERTAGTTALAIDHLAPRQSRRLALIGAGPVAAAHLRHALALRDWQQVHVWSPGLVADAARRTAFEALDRRVTVQASRAACVADADVVMLCTSSATPVLALDELTQPALVTSISTNAAQAHELDPAALAAMEVYCDYRRTTPGTAGEMVLAAQKHGWSAASVVGDLADLAHGRCAGPDGRRHVFFRSVGLGLEDVAMAHALYELLQQQRSALTQGMSP